ncbi:MAG: hypothetical protein ACLFUJ_03280 [Phycisphaerae bacterium]
MIYTCPCCQKDMQAPDDAVGHRIRCPYCKEVFPVHLPRAEVVEDPSEDSACDVVIIAEYTEEQPAPISDSIDPLDQLAAAVDPQGRCDWSFLGSEVEIDETDKMPARRPQPTPEAKGWYILTETDYIEKPVSTQQAIHLHKTGELEDDDQLFHARNGAIVPIGKLAAAVNKRIAQAKARRAEALRKRAAAEATAAPAEKVPEQTEQSSEALDALREALEPDSQ